MSYDVIISNSNLNCFGFRVLTMGIDIIQFARNPIMLWMHNRPYSGNTDSVLPLGTIENIRIEGDELKGTVKFDEADDFSKQIKAKWDAGTIRMVSAGLDPIERSEDAAYLLPGQRYATITKSKLIEVSVVDMGANDDALALYNDGKLITLKAGGNNEFLQPINNHLKEKSMKLIALKLGLSETATETEILAKIAEITLSAGTVAKLEGVIATQKLAVEGLEKTADEQKVVALAALVDGAITLKRITADKREQLINLGKTIGVDELTKTLELMAPSRKPGDFINLARGGAETTEYKKLSEVPEVEVIRLRSEDKESYIKLFKAEYGYEPSI